MDSKYYIKARKEGQKTYNTALQTGKVPYLPVLEDMVPTLNQMDRVALGVIAVPLSRVVGTVTTGRASAFASDFMPLLASNSEFATKWSLLYESVEAEGVREACKMLEYMGYYYLLEGNKRVSVMKFLGTEYAEADVTRVMPLRTDDPKNAAYFEYCAFSRETGLYDMFFTVPGSCKRLGSLPGVRSGEQWTDDDIMSLRKIYHYFVSAYQQEMKGKSSIPEADAFLTFVLAFGYLQVKDQNLETVRTNIRLMKDEFLLSDDKVELVMDAKSADTQVPLISSLFRPSRVKAAFLYARAPQESGWSYWHEMGRLELEEKLGGKVETTARVTTSRQESNDAIDELIREGYSVIFATSPVMLNSCVEPSLKHPDVKLLDCSQLAGFHHVRTYYLRFYEAKFLLGMAAGMLSKNGKIGYIADYPIYGSPSSINAFALGARMVNRDAKIYLNWTSLMSFDHDTPFHDPEIRVISNRDLTAPNPDSRDFGLYVRENGENLPMATLIPRWGIFYRNVIEKILSGAFDSAKASAPLNYWWGLSSGVIDLAFSKRFDTYGARLIRSMSSQFEDLSFSPFEGTLFDQQNVQRCDKEQRLTPAEVLCMDYLLDNVVGTLPTPEELHPSARPLVQLQGITGPRKADVYSIDWIQK